MYLLKYVIVEELARLGAILPTRFHNQTKPSKRVREFKTKRVQSNKLSLCGCDLTFRSQRERVIETIFSTSKSS